MNTADLDQVLAALESVDSGERVRAAWWLGERCSTEDQVCRALERSLGDPDPDVRGTAAEALGRIANRRADVLAVLLGYVEREPEPFVRARTVFGIGRSGSNGAAAVPLLRRFAATDTTHAYDTALWALGEIGLDAAEVVPMVTAGLSKPYSDQRWVAAKALGRFGSRAESAVPAIARALNDRHAIVRETAARALEEIAPDRSFSPQEHDDSAGTESLDDLLRSAADAHDRARRSEAVFLLGEQGPEAAGAAPAVIDILEDADEELQIAAITALGKIGAGAPAAIRWLVDALATAGPKLLGTLDWALGLVGPAAADAIGPVARQLAEYPETIHMHLEIRYHAVWALAWLDPVGVQSLPYLLRSLQDADSDVRAIAAENLGYIGNKTSEVTGQLTRLLSDPHEIVRHRANWALSRLST